MPYHVERSEACPAERPYAVVKDGTSEIKGCHDSEDAEQEQVAALYAAEPAARPVKATLLDDDAFRLLAIPFTGPIPSLKAPRGVDLDGEWFSPRTDIKPGWLTKRDVDWHHGNDSVFKRQVIGKAVDPVMVEDEGWWVTVWLDHGARRLRLIQQLAEKGASIFGSSESVSGMVKKDKATGEILVWPYWRQTLSTSPQNTKSVLRPLKAIMDDLNFESTTSAFWADVAPALTDVARDLRSTSAGWSGESVASDPLKAALGRLDDATLRALELVRRTTTRG